MRILFASSIFFFVFYGLNLLLLTTLNHRWWSKSWVRRVALFTPPAALSLSGLWGMGAWLDRYWLVATGAGLLSALFLYLAGFLAAQLITGSFHAGEKLFDLFRTHSSDRPPSSPERRLFLRRTMAGVPLLTSGLITGGLIHASTPARLPRVPLRFPDLPVPLEGLKILHLTDMHIGLYVQLHDLEKLLERAADHKPDLVLLTGDLCDHLPDYSDILKLVEALHPPLGLFASPGNHEYFRGIARVRQAFSQSSIPLLTSTGVTIQEDGQNIYIGGADDPRHMHKPGSYQQLQPFVEQALDSAPSDAFHILMSHRSRAFDFAAPLGVDLQLSGHTHGFQIGVGGRSLFEGWMPDRYIWGSYQKGDRQLYTSSGVGHWFPFRLGCPPEAPILILQRT